MRRIVLFTDCVDVAANELRATLISATAEFGNLEIEPFVPISPAFSKLNTNFVIRLMAENYPEGTLFMTTINAERERPRNVIGRTQEKNIIFIGRNMGSFDWLTRDFGCQEPYDLSAHNAGGFVSFAGKYTTAHLAAKAASGVALETLGDAMDPNDIVRLAIRPGTIVHIDNFGMMKFTGEIGPANEGDEFEVEINGHTIDVVFGRRMMSFETGRWVLFPGSSFGLFELGKVREIGAPLLGANVGSHIGFRKKS